MKVIFFANTDWYLYNFRRSLAQAAVAAGYEVLLVSPPGEHGERLRALGLRWQPIQMDRRSLNPIREIAVLRQLVKLVRNEHAVLMHGFTVKCAVYGSIAARLARIPSRISAVAGMGYVFTNRGINALVLRPFVRFAMKLAFSGHGSRVILQNGDDVAIFEKARLIDPKRIRLIRSSGVDCSLFKPTTRSEDPRRPIRVVLAARLLWDKGIGEYVTAARALRSSGRNIVFLLAGLPDAGNPAAVPEAEVHQWVQEGVVEWLGQVDDMASLFATVDAVVLPSYYGEGLPRSLTEGAASGLPIITCDSPGCREVVTNGVEGLLVPPRDADALAGAIAQLVDDPSLRQRFGQAARAKALAEFDERIVIEKTLAVYKELLPEIEEV